MLSWIGSEIEEIWLFEKGLGERPSRARRAWGAEESIFRRKAARDAELKAQRVKRQDKKQLMRKKTKRGQPVMKHRVQSILDKLQAEQMGSW